MKELDKKVNIIPIISKADTISRQELLQFKKKVSIWLFVWSTLLIAWGSVCMNKTACYKLEGNLA